MLCGPRMQVERGEAMELVCPSCRKSLGTVEAVARLILTVHCPFDGTDFGVAVEPSEPVADASAATGGSAPAPT